ncbi:hypothetical protein O53_1782 [Microcystis aeruginosa TAIHU98]|uniref:Uncharacterized protein n=1 Tax=Microcystis aeruginosa TAIHU98 TaxID=1134457 RepID=L7ECJ1_MICAE|nr:hypothetical protein O53_1782 [Microcystis aeruginosa TAIHU98]
MVKNVVCFLFITGYKISKPARIKLMIEINSYAKNYHYLVKIFSIDANKR